VFFFEGGCLFFGCFGVSGSATTPPPKEKKKKKKEKSGERGGGGEGGGKCRRPGRFNGKSPLAGPGEQGT